MSPEQFMRLPMFDQFWVLLMLMWFLGGPFVFTYCLVRFFRDLRQLVKALWAIDHHLRERREAVADAGSAEEYRHVRTVANSMFGR